MSIHWKTKYFIYGIFVCIILFHNSIPIILFITFQRINIFLILYGIAQLQEYKKHSCNRFWKTAVRNNRQHNHTKNTRHHKRSRLLQEVSVYDKPKYDWLINGNAPDRYGRCIPQPDKWSEIQGGPIWRPVWHAGWHWAQQSKGKPIKKTYSQCRIWSARCKYHGYQLHFRA